MAAQRLSTCRKKSETTGRDQRQAGARNCPPPRSDDDVRLPASYFPFEDAGVMAAIAPALSPAWRQMPSIYRWRQAFGGLKISPVKRRKELETDNPRLDVWVMERSNLLATGHWRHRRCWFGGGQGFLPAFRQASNVMMGMVTSMQPLVNMPATSATSRILKTGFMAGWLSSYIESLACLFTPNRAGTLFGRRIRRCQGMQDRPPLDGTATRAAGPACSLALPEVGVRGMFRPYTHFLGRRVVTAEGCSACSRRVWRGHFPRVACRRGQGLGAAFVRPDARRRHEACLPRPVTRPCRRVKRTVARRFLRYQADISGCSAFATPALACGRLADLSSAN